MIEEIVATLATIRAADAVALDDKEAAKATRIAQVKLTLFDGSAVTLAFTKLAGATPNDQGKAFVRVGHSDPKHQANAAAKKAVFVAASWLVEQIPGSLAEFKKAQQPATDAPAPTFQIPGPAPTAPSPLLPTK